MSRYATRLLITPGPGATQVQPAAVARACAAIQRQLREHFQPLWNIDATIDFYPDPRYLPSGYAPIFVVDRLRDSAYGGYHRLDGGEPYALVAYDDDYWTVDASHEALEMIVDPYGSNVVTGYSPDDNHPGRVQFINEICDPGGRLASAYEVDEVWVSDFHTPIYYDTVAVPGARYSYTGKLKAPKALLSGGYMTWYDEVRRQWYQRTRTGTNEQTHAIGRPDFGQSLRQFADAQSAQRRAEQRASRRRPPKPVAGRKKLVYEAGCARAKRFHEAVAGLAESAG